jgi:hypothetical protein
MNHAKAGSHGTGSFHVWTQLGRILVWHFVTGLSGWVSSYALDPSSRLDPPTLSNDEDSRAVAESGPTGNDESGSTERRESK